MSINSIDFLSSAKESVEIEGEANLRNAISRGYYSMYHECLGSLECLPDFHSNHHSNLVGYMSSKSECKNEPYEPNRLKVLAYRLLQQRGERNRADYEITTDIPKEVGVLAIETAKIFFEDWGVLKKSKTA
ncbi:MAG: hypothetical protein ACTIOQ_23285 [Serratia grimesii]|uniref:hypothetical protein n=1 Tax=Serratia grimesii TaxID=82995 RepID=UPI003F982477